MGKGCSFFHTQQKNRSTSPKGKGTGEESEKKMYRLQMWILQIIDPRIRQGSSCNSTLPGTLPWKQRETLSKWDFNDTAHVGSEKMEITAGRGLACRLPGRFSRSRRTGVGSHVFGYTARTCTNRRKARNLGQTRRLKCCGLCKKQKRGWLLWRDPRKGNHDESPRLDFGQSIWKNPMATLAKSLGPEQGESVPCVASEWAKNCGSFPGALGLMERTSSDDENDFFSTDKVDTL